MRYLTNHNFMGRRVPGYRENVCLLTRQAATALATVQKAVKAEGYTLKVYDCYRPQRSVDAFVRWGKDLSDQRMKREFYPRVRKSRVFKEGYIADPVGPQPRQHGRPDAGQAPAAQAGALPPRRPPARLRRPAEAPVPRQHDRHGHGLRLL